MSSLYTRFSQEWVPPSVCDGVFSFGLVAVKGIKGYLVRAHAHTGNKPSRARRHSPSSPRSCYCLPCPWSKAHSSPSSRKSETASASSRVSCLSPWWSGQRTTCCPRRCDGTSCSSSGRSRPRVRRQEEAPVAEAAAADPGAAAAAGGGGGGGDDVDAHSFPPDTENHCRAQAVSAPHTPHSPPPTSRGYWRTRRFLPAPAAPRVPGRMCWSWPGRWAPAGAAAKCRTAGGREAQIPGLYRPAVSVVAVPRTCQESNRLSLSHSHKI